MYDSYTLKSVALVVLTVTLTKGKLNPFMVNQELFEGPETFLVRTLNFCFSLLDSALLACSSAWHCLSSSNKSWLYLLSFWSSSYKRQKILGVTQSFLGVLQMSRDESKCT